MLILSQKNAVFEQVQGHGLDPREFDWELLGDSERLVHTPSEYSFLFSETGGMHYVSYSPGKNLQHETQLLGDQFSAVLDRVSEWLSSLMRELTAPNLWATLEAERAALTGGEVENTPFSVEEQRQIAAQL